jgi:hypothetical protein
MRLAATTTAISAKVRVNSDSRTMRVAPVQSGTNT